MVKKRSKGGGVPAMVMFFARVRPGDKTRYTARKQAQAKRASRRVTDAEFFGLVLDAYDERERTS